jgi:hypothetical protein
MKLANPFEFDETVQPIALPPANHTIADNEMVTITGWGAVSEDGPSSNYLRWVYVPSVPRAVCQESYSSVGLAVTDSMMCDGVLEEGGKDSCR